MGSRLEGRVTLVTGAGSSGPGLGNGKAAAVLYAREGGIVFAVDINPDAVAETQDLIDGEGGDCTSHVADVSDASAVEAAVAACLEKHGRIDVLHNNVGLVDLDGPVELPEETWDRMMDVNVKGMFLTCKHVLPVMECQGKGAIVNISSVAGIRYWGTPAIAYNTSKAAIVQFTKSVALQYARKGIRANCVLPGVIDTPLIAPDPAAHTPEELEAIQRERHNMIPIGHMGEAWDIAQASVFLASDDAKYITGAELVVDGGLTCTCIPNW
jgi:NAD(P)-dependent dehydrogenase (short-subunit alcohol dehydrogenase family)